MVRDSPSLQTGRYSTDLWTDCRCGGGISKRVVGVKSRPVQWCAAHDGYGCRGGGLAGHLNIDCMTKGGCDTGYTGSQFIAKACLPLVLGLYEKPLNRRQDEGSDCSPPPPGQLDRGPKLVMSPHPARGQEASSTRLCSTSATCNAPSSFSGWASDEQRPAVTQASGGGWGRVTGASRTPIGKILISQAWLAWARRVRQMGRKHRGKGNGPRSPSLDCCSDARCQVGWTKAMMPGTIDCLVEGLLMCDVASSDV